MSRLARMEVLLREALLHLPDGGRDNYLPERIRAELGIPVGDEDGPGEEDGTWAEGWETRFWDSSEEHHQ